jgi:NitT/TauT family transport system substrate-binding protein
MGWGYPQKGECLMRKHIVLSLGILVIFGLVHTILSSPVSAKDKTRLILDWLPYGSHVGIFAAEDKGFYDQQNLAVNLQRGFGSADTVKRSGAKEADFAFADLPSAIVGRSRGTKIKSVGVHFDKGLNAVYVLKSSGVKTPKELEGKTFGDTAGGATRTLVPAFMGANGIKNLPWVPMTPAAKNPSLITGKVISIGTLTINEWILRNMARKKGDDVVMFPFSDHGVDVYGHAFYVHENLLKQKPELIRRFLKATYQGIAWAVANPDDGVKLFLKRVPTRTFESVRFEWAVTVRSLMTDFAKKNGIGHIDEKKMAFTIDTMTRLMNLPRRVAPSEMYTNQFLPKLSAN